MNNNTFTNITTRQGNKYILNDSMTEKESSALYLATMKALGSHAYDIISIDNTESANGPHLWTLLDEHFNEREDSFLLKHDIKDKFLSLKREPNESIEQYRIKFEKQLHILSVNSISLPSRLELVYQFLHNMQIKRVFDDIIMKMDIDDTFFRNLNWKQLSTKSNRQIKLYTKIHPNHDPYGKRPKEKQKPHTPSPSTPLKKKTPPPSIKDKAHVPDTPFQSTIVQDEVNKVRDLLKNSSNPKYDLHELHTKYPASCPFHNSKTHPLMNCNLLARVCQDCGLGSTYTHVHSTLNLAPKPTPNGPPPYNGRTNPYAPRRDTPPPPSTLPTPQWTPVRQRNPTSQARRMTEDEVAQPTQTDYYNNPFEALAEDDIPCDEDNNVDDITNNDTLNPYPSILRTHLAPLPYPTQRVTFAPNSNPSPTPHTLAYAPTTPLPQHPSFPTSITRMVIDSGASAHMSSSLNLFESVTFFDKRKQPTVIMGDDKTQIPISGHGFMNLRLHGKHIRIHGLYIPGMGATSLFSVKQYIKHQGCYFHAEAKCSELAFPTFTCSPRIADEIDIIVSPAKDDASPLHFDEHTSLKLQISTPASTVRTCPDTTLLHLLSSTKHSFLDQSNYHKYTDTVAIHKLVSSASLPTRATKSSLGFDVKSLTPAVLLPGQTATIPTGLSTALPYGMSINIVDRPNTAADTITTVNSVIDSNFRGEIHITLRNNGPSPVCIASQQTIAQFIFQRATVPHIQVHPSSPASHTNMGGSSYPSILQQQTHQNFPYQWIRISPYVPRG